MRIRSGSGIVAAALLLSGCVANQASVGPENSLLARAKPELAQAVRRNPNNGEAWFQLGNDFAEKDQLIEAEAAYRQALMLRPNPKAQHNLGLVHIRLGIEALRSSAQQLPADHPSRIETKKFLELMTQSGF